MKIMFVRSYVHPYIVPDVNCRGGYYVEGEVNWNRLDGEFDHHGRRICFGWFHDDDYVDHDKLLEDMRGKTIYEANNIFQRHKEEDKYR